MPDLSRPTRRFVLGLAAAGIAKIAQAAAPADHALVCVYLLGGNDGNNLIVPLERSQYQAYERLHGPLAYSDLQGLFPRLSGNANLGFMA